MGIDTIKTQVGGEQINRFVRMIERHDNTAEGLSKVNLTDALKLLWLGMHDDSHLPVEISSRTLAIEDSVSGLKKVMTELLNTYGADSAACFGGMFNGLMHYAYTAGVPGAAVLMDEAEKGLLMDILRERHSLAGAYSKLTPEQKQPLIEDEAAFEQWRDGVKERQEVLLARYNPDITLSDNSKPLDFLAEPLQEIKDSLSVSFEEFQSEVGAKSVATLLPCFKSLKKEAEDMDKLSMHFHKLVNIDSLIIDKDTFVSALKEAGVVNDDFSVDELSTYGQGHLDELVNKLFDSQVTRMISEAELSQSGPQELYAASENWQAMKQIWIDACATKGWVNNNAVVVDVSSTQGVGVDNEAEPGRRPSV